MGIHQDIHNSQHRDYKCVLSMLCLELVSNSVSHSMYILHSSPSSLTCANVTHCYYASVFLDNGHFSVALSDDVL